MVPLQLAIAFAVSLCLSAVLVPLARLLGLRYGYCSQPRESRWSRRTVPHSGGLAVFLAFALPAWLLAPASPIKWILAGLGALVLALGVFDDIFHIKPSSKLIGQIIMAAAATQLGQRVDVLPWELADLCLSMFWIVATINAFNLLDNMDGLAAGIGVIALGFLIPVFVWKGQAAPALLATLLAGSLAGFLAYNFNPASIFMGDAGSLFVGFSLGLLSMQTVSSHASLAAITVPALVLAVPLVDMVFVSLTRVLRGRSIAQGGRDHTSHRLVALGLSDRKAVLVLYSLAATAGGLAVWVTMSPVKTAALVTFPLVLVCSSLIGIYLFQMTYVADAPAEDGDPGAGTWMTTILFHLTYKRRILQVLLDFALIPLAYYLAYALKFDFAIPEPYRGAFESSLPLTIIMTLGSFFCCGIYRNIWRFASIRDVVRILSASALSALLLIAAAVLINRFNNFPRSTFPLYAMLLFMLTSITRFSVRFLDLIVSSLRGAPPHAIPVMIYGAGEEGEMVARDILRRNGSSPWVPVGFLDDDATKDRLRIHGVPVLGGTKDLQRIHRDKPFQQIILSSDQVPPEAMSRTLEFCRKNNIRIKRFLTSYEDIDGQLPEDWVASSERIPTGRRHIGS